MGWTEMGQKKWFESASCAMGRIFTVSELGGMDLGRPWKMQSSRETTYWYRPKSIRPQLFDQKGQPNSFRPISFDPFHAIPLNAGAKRSGATCHMAMPQCCYFAKGAKRPSHTTSDCKYLVYQELELVSYYGIVGLELTNSKRRNWTWNWKDLRAYSVFFDRTPTLLLVLCN